MTSSRVRLPIDVGKSPPDGLDFLEDRGHRRRASLNAYPLGRVFGEAVIRFLLFHCRRYDWHSFQPSLF